MPEVSVIIPNWNGKKLLPPCLAGVFGQTFSDFEIIVVDNGSTDGSVNFVKKNYPKVQLIKLPKNLGFASAVNRGIAECKSKYLALLNNDARPDKNWLSNLYGEIVSRPEVFAVVPKVINSENKKIIDNAGDKINIIGQAEPRGKGDDASKYDRAGYIFGASGAASLFKREVFDRLGKFDEDFFFYFEDVDFSLRAQLAGYKCWYQPKALVYHLGQITAAKLGDFIEYQRFRNTIFLVVKNFPVRLFFKRNRWWKIPIVWLHTFYFFARIGLGKMAFKVFLDVIIYFPKLIIKRLKIMKLRKVDINYFDSLMEDKKLKIFGLRS